VTRRVRRRKLAKPSPQRLALLAYLEHVMQDPVAARLATDVVGMHQGLVAWMAEAERSHVLPQPFRLPGDERVGGVSVAGVVSGTREPDDRMMRLVDDRLVSVDPEGLDPVRQRLAHRLGELAAWYLSLMVGQVDVAEWEPLAVRLGDLLGDQVAANAMATCLLCHARFAPSLGYEVADQDLQLQRHRKNARERWRRLAEWYVRVLDDQPTKGRRTSQGRVQVESVGPDGERKFG
jgi:hypothetical protein